MVRIRSQLMQTPPPTPESPDSPCPKKIMSYLKQPFLNDCDVRGRRSLAEIFELVLETNPKPYTLRHEELPNANF